jgi:hypothetical protein
MRITKSELRRRHDLPLVVSSRKSASHLFKLLVAERHVFGEVTAVAMTGGATAKLQRAYELLAERGHLDLSFWRPHGAGSDTSMLRLGSSIPVARR